MALKLQHTLTNRLEQRLKLSPQILLSLRFLQLPLLDLEQRVSQELSENPFLELKENTPEEGEGPETAPEAPTEDATDPDTPLTAEEEAQASFEEMEREFSDYMNRAGEIPKSGVGPSRGDEKMEALANAPAHGIPLSDHLQDQLHLLELDPVIRKAAEFIIENLDKNGFLPYQMPDLASSANDEQITEDKLREALAVVQALDPIGVGARDVTESLIIQLDPSVPLQELGQKILKNHLTELSKNQLPKIARALGVGVQDINDAIQVIGRLNPRPGAAFSEEETHYVVPDVIVEEIDGRFEVRLESGNLPNITISPSYQRLLSQAANNPEVVEALRKKLESAKWILTSIEQRRMTLYNVACAIVERQEDFMRRGLEAMKPLRMVDVAEKLEVHVSTVGRALSDKYMQTPQGIFAMKYFFSGGTSNTSGEEMSWRTVRQTIADLIATEDKSHPLSDEEIVDQLKNKGIEVARRTVAKYRTALKIPSSRKRKQF